MSQSVGRCQVAQTSLLPDILPMAAEELEFFENLNAAIEAAKIRKFDEVMIIGGGSLYAEALEITDRRSI